MSIDWGKIVSLKIRVVAIEGIIRNIRLPGCRFGERTLSPGDRIYEQPPSLQTQGLESDASSADVYFNLRLQLEESQFYRRHEPWCLDYPVIECLFGLNKDSQIVGVSHSHHISFPESRYGSHSDCQELGGPYFPQPSPRSGRRYMIERVQVRLPKLPSIPLFWSIKESSSDESIEVVPTSTGCLLLYNSSISLIIAENLAFLFL